MSKNKLTQKRLLEVISYDHLTGILRWKINRQARKIKGKIAGTRRKDGYIKVGIDGHEYYAHRLAWLYMYGYFPEHNIDHKDCDPSNNLIKNLREASKQCNARNTKRLKKNNTSGCHGVVWLSKEKKWQAQIKINYKNYSLGYFTDFIEAVSTRFAAEQCVDWSDCNLNSSASIIIKKNIHQF